MPSVNKTLSIGLNQWQGNEYPKREDFNSDNEKIDAAIGNMTIDDTQAPTGDTGLSIKILLSWLSNMIKAITGKSNWRTAPVKSIEQLNTEFMAHEADNKAHGVGNKIDKSLATAADLVMMSSGVGSWTVKSLAQFKTWLGLGDAAYMNTGIASGTVAAGDHNHNGVYEPVNSNIVKTNVAVTMAAILTAQNNTSYTTKQVRNITLSTGDPSGGSNGDIWIKYKD